MTKLTNDEIELRELTRQMAGWHQGDHDECGEVANRVLALLEKTQPKDRAPTEWERKMSQEQAEGLLRSRHLTY